MRNENSMLTSFKNSLFFGYCYVNNLWKPKCRSKRVVGHCDLHRYRLYAAASDQIPGAPQTKPIAIVGATVHTVSGEFIEGGTVVFVAGKITALGKAFAVPEDAEVIKADGKHLYPTLIDANTDSVWWKSTRFARQLIRARRRDHQSRMCEPLRRSIRIVN